MYALKNTPGNCRVQETPTHCNVRERAAARAAAIRARLAALFEATPG